MANNNVNMGWGDADEAHDGAENEARAGAAAPDGADGGGKGRHGGRLGGGDGGGGIGREGSGLVGGESTDSTSR